MFPNLKEITKQQLAVQVNSIEKEANSKNTVYTGFYLEDEYCERPEIYKQAIFGMGDSETCLFIYERVGIGGQFYWCGGNEPYTVSSQELIEKLWKIIQRDYQ